MSEPKEQIRFKVGEWAEWWVKPTFSKMGVGHIAECIEIVPSGRFPKTCGRNTAIPRDHESYVFAEPLGKRALVRKIYYPRVTALKKVEAQT